MATHSNINLILSNLPKINLNELSETNLDQLKKLKSGHDFVIKSSNEFDTFLLTSIHILSKVEANLFELFPRTLIICNEIDTCEKLEKMFNTLSFNFELKTVVIHDKGNSVIQRNVLYEGIDIVIGTPKRICELYFQNGINLKNLKSITILESESISNKGGLTQLMRIHESLPKCQKVIFLDNENLKSNEKLNNFIDLFTIQAKLLE
jgi:ATP-dependent RNA helicase RhlE